MKDSDKERFLNQRSDKFTIILNDNECNLLQSSRHIFSRFMTCEDIGLVYIAVIRHDKDYDEVQHHLKTLHYHVVIHLNKICRIGTLINKIVDLFHVNENQITIDKCNSIVMQSRYLTHLDDFDKYQYDFYDIVCNDLDVLNRYYKLVIVRDLHDLIAVVKHYHYELEEIMQNVSNYDKWRKYINDLIINYNRKRY